MARCKHRHVTSWSMSIPVDPMHFAGIRTIMRWRECNDCGEWLSLGPANDDSEAVKVEIRAAEIAMPPDCLSWSVDIGISELIGKDIHRHDRDHEAPYNAGQWAGWLACCIATHDDDSDRRAQEGQS